MEQSPAPTPPGANSYQGNTSNIDSDQRNGLNETPLRNFNDSFQIKSCASTDQNCVLPGNNRKDWNIKMETEDIIPKLSETFPFDIPTFPTSGFDCGLALRNPALGILTKESKSAKKPTKIFEELCNILNIRKISHKITYNISN